MVLFGCINESYGVGGAVKLSRESLRGHIQPFGVAVP